MTSRGLFQVELFYDAVIQSLFQISKSKTISEGLLRKANKYLGFLLVFFSLLAHIFVTSQIDNSVIILPIC